MKKALIIGAGPAGLTAAYELLTQTKDIEVIVFEESGCYGGISKTVQYKGNRMDMGGHRFFSKDSRVNEWWHKMLPLQGAPSLDDILLGGRRIPLAVQGPDPEQEDAVMLIRRRISRILFGSRFYDYPISLKWETFRNLGLRNTLAVAFSYLASVLRKLPEDNLENFYINRFGRRLYSMFFEYYTENLWGRHPREIDAAWGAQRVKGLSILAVIKDIFRKCFRQADRKVETSLIEEFQYPKFGPGQLWDIVAAKVEELGGTILKNSRVVSLYKDEEGRIASVCYEKNGETASVEGDYVLSSMPIKDLIEGMNNVPAEALRIASGLPYRDYMTLGVLVDRLALENKTSVKTVGDIVPDCWIYVQNRSVRMGRFQIYNNWSPYMVSDLANTVWLGLEYFVNEGDCLWNMTEEEFSEVAVDEMIALGLIHDRSAVLDTHMERVRKAYPAYFDTYREMDKLIAYINTIPNLFCVGRNGQHRYNNIDHSMVTSFEAVRNILTGRADKSNIWNVNTEQEYHESQ